MNGKLSNLIVAGFSDVGVFFEEATVAQAQAGKLTLSQSYFWNNGPSGDAKNIADVTTVGATSFDVKGWVLSQPGNVEADPMLIDPFNATAPKFALKPGSPALLGGPPPSDSFFTAVTHIGAFGTEDWTAGWTAFPAN